MAGKSFLSRLGKQKKSYKVKQYQNKDRSQSATNGEMAGRFTSSSSSSASAGGGNVSYLDLYTGQTIEL